MPLFFEKLAGFSPIADTFVAFFAHLPTAFWLDRTHHPTDRFTVIGTGAYVNCDNIQLGQLRTALTEFEDDQQLPFGFRPGLVGVINYELSEPAGDLLKVDRAIVFDHDAKSMYFLGVFEDRSDFEYWYHAALLRLTLLGGDAKTYQQANEAAVAAELTAEHTKKEYLAAIQAAQDNIAKGNIYQLCLTTRLRGDFTGDPLSYFLRLRSQHNAPYATYLKTPGVQYVSISPERLLTVSQGNVLSTPIKGTRARSEDPVIDSALKSELVLDPKERAENMMIVDLIRNDLSKVCKPESVVVQKLLEVVSYSTVHQLISEVIGQLRLGEDAISALQAIFPGGSMTGAPKQAAIKLAAELEKSPRSGYSGAIGYLGGDGGCDLAMVIRTAIFQGTQVSIGIGGGIMLDSDPEMEHREIQLKAQALVSGLSATVRW